MEVYNKIKDRYAHKCNSTNNHIFCIVQQSPAHDTHSMQSPMQKDQESAMNLRFVDEHEKNNELVRTKTNSGGVSSYRVSRVRCLFFFIPVHIGLKEK